MIRRRRKSSNKTTQAAIGTFNLAAAQKAAGDQLRAWTAQGLLDPRNMEAWASATTYAQKNIEKLAETAAIAGAPLEGLKRLQVEAGSVRTQLDQFATTSMTPLCGTLRSIDFSGTA